MSTNINELMSVLASAKEAQDAVPAMKAELARLQRALDASQAEASRYKQASEDIGVELKSAKDQIGTLGSERDEAQFRTLELEDKLATISKVMGSALGLVEPQKASEVKVDETPKVEETAPEPVSVPQVQPQHGQEYKNGYYDDHGHWVWYNEAHQSTAPEVASPPTPTQGEPGASVPKDIAETASMPTSSSGEVPSTPTVSSASPSNGAPNGQPEDKSRLYAGVGWQDKPGYISYQTFVEQGGEKPYWM